ncbi:MAG: DUF4373 domain-containing protein [Tannerellaceae bacterium]|jgi:hypothetical protein|nr:DUF4373 domain-containing protein [Tannerellaceae bacterium]
MARTNKSGLDYYPFDIDFFQDEKIQFVSARFGTKGESITVRLLCKIYRNGYYVEFNDDTALLFAKGVGDGCRDYCVKGVVEELLKRGFFDKDLFERFGILTSRGIQNRYFEIIRRREKVDIIEDYLLIDVSGMTNVNINRINVDINSINVDINSQSKVKEKERKEKGKRKESKENPPTPQGGDVCGCEVVDEFSFENAWAMYGRKGNKKTSARKWANLKNHCREAALKHIPLYVRSTPEIQYRKNFETYINQECWNDELILKNNGNKNTGNSHPQSQSGVSDDYKRNILERLLGAGHSEEMPGNQPV